MVLPCPLTFLKEVAGAHSTGRAVPDEHGPRQEVRSSRHVDKEERHKDDVKNMLLLFFLDALEEVPLDHPNRNEQIKYEKDIHVQFEEAIIL